MLTLLLVNGEVYFKKTVYITVDIVYIEPTSKVILVMCIFISYSLINNYVYIQSYPLTIVIIYIKNIYVSVACFPSALYIYYNAALSIRNIIIMFIYI